MINTSANAYTSTSRPETREIKPKESIGKIWIDIDNSPHVPFFVPIIEEPRHKGRGTSDCPQYVSSMRAVRVFSCSLQGNRGSLR